MVLFWNGYCKMYENLFAILIKR